MAMLKNMIAIVANILKEISSIYFFFGMMLMVCADVFMRLVFNRPIPGTLEMNEFGVVILTYLCFGYTAVQRRHINTTVFIDYVPSAIRYIAEVFALLAMLAFSGLLIWRTTIGALESISIREYTAGLIPFPKYPVKIFIPVGLFAGWLYFLNDFLILLKLKKNGG